jgi:uncharacterized membrane protein YoaT (DUF817 family)
MKKTNLIIDLALAVGLLLQVLYLNNNPELLFITLLLYNILVLILRRSSKLLKLFIFCSLFGVLSEIVAISFGVWSYATPQFFGVPFWLFMVWGHAGIFMYRVGKYFE